MTNEGIIRIARTVRNGGHWNQLDIIRFAHLVAAAEREQCAKVCDSKVAAEYNTGKVDHNEIGWTQACAAAIRARGGGDA